MNHRQRLLLVLILPLIVVAAFNWRLLTVMTPLAFSIVEPVKAVSLENNTLAIPSVGLTAPIIPSATDPSETSSWSVVREDLKRGVSLAERLPKPGEPGTTLITGHSSDWLPHRYAAVFAPLHYVKEGDEIVIRYSETDYRYTITEKKVVDPSNLNFFKEELQQTEGKHRLALITCTPLLTTARRLVVIGELTPN